MLANASGGPRALSEAILRVLEDTTAATRMGAAGHQQAKSVYSWQSVAAVYEKAYDCAIQHARSTKAECQSA